MRPHLFLIQFLFFFSFCKAQKLNREELGLIPPSGSPCTVVKDQYMSATCWSFASNSLLESELLKNGKKDIDLSEMFVARYSMLRKIHRHLALKGQNFFTPGGQFHDVVWVLKNHGIVPESAYPGKPGGALNHNHSDMDTVISRFVKKLVENGVTGMNLQHEQFVDSVLNVHMGPVPAQFTYHGMVYTPHSFLQKALNFNPDDYIEITSYTHHPFYQRFVLEDKYNWTNDAYYNVTMADFSGITDNALASGFTVGWDGDAEDMYFDYYGGIAYLPDTIPDFQKYRQRAFESQGTLLNHMMHIVGVVSDKEGKKWYYIKNSWGSYSNSLGGFLFMRDDYFKIRT
ncbi:MAG: hypothetical protein H7Y01_12070, partial [Ferruginibacter sp.]|nr:hypothetical protein [Chitinophagaceae bacterium]